MTHSQPIRLPHKTFPPLIGARIAKTALAVGVAWAAAQALGQPYPIFAAMAALNALKPTIASSVRHTGAQLVGMLLGTLLAVVAATMLDTERPAAVGLGVLIALLATVRLGAHGLLGTEVAVTTLLVLAMADGQPAFGILRLWEAALGGAIAVVVNALVLPPDYRGELRESLRTLAADLERHTREAVDALLRPATPAEAWAQLLDVRASVRKAETLMAQAARAREAARFSPLLRYSPFRAGAIEEIERLAAGVNTLAGALDHARTAARIAWHASQRPGMPIAGATDWSAAVDAAASAVRAFETQALEHSHRTHDAAESAVDRAAKQIARLISESSEIADLDRAAVLSEVEHILVDLSVGLKQSRPVLEAAPTPPEVNVRLARTSSRVLPRRRASSA